MSEKQANALKRVPPNNVEAEMAVLGAMLLGSAEGIEKAREMLAVDDFYRPTFGEIFSAILALADRHCPVDAVTLKEELTWRGTLETIGGISAVLELSDVGFSSSSIEAYAAIVAEKAARRRLLETCAELAAAAYDTEDETPDLLETAERRILAIRDNERWSGGKSKQGTDLSDLVKNTMERIMYQSEHKGEIIGVETGFRQLDAMLAGMQRGDLIILAGRPSMGKSAMATQIFTHICMSGGSSVFFSLEMSEEQLGQRIVCSEARVNAQLARTGYVQQHDLRRLESGAERLDLRKGRICEDTSLTVSDMRAICRRHKSAHGLDAVFVDYVQLIGKDREQSRYGSQGENRNLEVAAISKALKGLAREFLCPVVALAQLSRAVERREDKTPMLSDLRDSGSLEQDADVVLFPFRLAYYEALRNKSEGDPLVMEEAEVIVAKQRMGARGSVPIGFIPGYARFENVTKENESRF